MSDTRDQIEQAIAGAIQDGGDMVTKWVALVEGINGDGERYLWIMADDSSTAWDRMGMLQFARIQEQADVACDPARRRGLGPRRR